MSDDDFSDDDAHAGGDMDPEMDPNQSTLNVDVGSSLTSHDWADIDNSDLVAKVRGSAGFRIMREIAPWDGALVDPPALLQGKVFEFFYVQRKEADMWKALAKECFPAQYEAASSDKSEKKRLSSLWAQAVLDEIKAMREHGKHTLRWITAVLDAQASDHLFLRREALKHGPHSIEAKAAAIVWAQCSNRIKDQAFAAMHLWTNKGGAQSGGIARMYKHQHDLLEELDAHFTAVTKAVEAERQLPMPLHVILSTPTGSGKTFTALMVHLRLFKVKHPNAILVYSVPTKQVLKRVGQECEAHAAPYWTAARDHSGEGLCQVRRPYSIRDKARNRKAMRAKAAIGEKQSAGSGTIESQLEYAAQVGFSLKDRGAGRPDIIIADLNTTAWLLKAAHNAKDTSFYHKNNLLLYFDEPNMGIHLDPNVLGVVSTIQAHMPIAAVLASATLGPWEGLEQWWRGPVPARQITISLLPYDLPMSTLNVWSEDKGTLAPVSPLGLFANYAEFQRTMADDRMPTLLLRHLTASQGNDLLGIKGPGGPWDMIQGDVKSLRVTVEPIFKGLSYADFSRFKAQWATGDGAAKKVDGLRGALSKEGVTMVGCLDPRKVALLLAGYGDQEQWKADEHRLNAKLKEADRMMKESAKQEKRAKKKEEEEDAQMGDDDLGQIGLITLRPMLKVTVAEAMEANIDTLIMLSKGIAYACGSGTDPMVKRLYNQALLTVPDSLKGRAPPLNVLVVDYSSIYGTDCPAVDTLLLQEDLGSLLAWEDLQQFLGRLRRDGTAIFYSLRTLRRAAIGPGAELAENKAELDYQQEVEAAMLGMQDASKTRDAKEEVEALTKLAESKGRAMSETAAFATTSVLSFVLPAPINLPAGLPKVHPTELAGTDKELLAALQKQLKTNCDVLKKLLKKRADQVMAINKIEKLALSASPFVNRTGGVRYLGAAGQTLKLMYDMDIITEEAVTAWGQQRTAPAGLEGPDLDARFYEKAKPFITWLEEASSSEEESGSDEE
eukprot:CAMPEP_0181363940 /NCGR_PEP_ID=MMETSP1106-20121128/9065_1 /TAXON_ID=81844 /ORGANISM="Mantoniella antarctica, Strain SL-175" /LENGTH=1005 /DNA_ID=CAMNT_0023478509 /DNA_START=163 /DNA_END=3180 /DNA_ORIENTATION=+